MFGWSASAQELELCLSCSNAPLFNNQHPDIAFAVSQVAQFNHAPKQSQAAAVKMIVCYLVCTADYGMTFHPTGRLDIECYVDAVSSVNEFHVPCDSHYGTGLHPCAWEG